MGRVTGKREKNEGGEEAGDKDEASSWPTVQEEGHRVSVSLVAMVTLDHSFPRPPAHLFSTLGLGAGPEEQPLSGEGRSLGDLGKEEARYLRTGRVEILESGATHLSGRQDATPTPSPL